MQEKMAQILSKMQSADYFKKCRYYVKHKLANLTGFIKVFII
jgi:hypothetical protein